MCYVSVQNNCIHSSTVGNFMKKIKKFLKDNYEDCESLENVEKSSYVLDSELGASKFDKFLLSLVKDCFVGMWEIPKHKLYGSDSGSGQ